MAGLTYRFTFIDVNEETPAFAPRSLTEQLVSGHELIPEELARSECVKQLCEEWAQSETEPHFEPVRAEMLPEVLPDISTGSAGHPNFCSRPCTYFSKGSCRNGDSCSFCHLPHCHTPKLDKRQRMVVAKLCTYDRLSLALVALQLKANRAEKQRVELPVQELLVLLQEQIQRCSQEERMSTITRYHNQFLSRILSKHSVPGILAILDCGPELEAKVQNVFRMIH